jgi:hypothetical protein
MNSKTPTALDAEHNELHQQLEMIVVDFPPMTCCVRAHASRHALKTATTLLAGPMRLTLTAADVAVLTRPGGLGRRGPVGGAAGSQPAAANLSAERDG